MHERLLPLAGRVRRDAGRDLVVVPREARPADVAQRLGGTRRSPALPPGSGSPGGAAAGGPCGAPRSPSGRGRGRPSSRRRRGTAARRARRRPGTGAGRWRRRPGRCASARCPPRGSRASASRSRRRRARRQRAVGAAHPPLATRDTAGRRPAEPSSPVPPAAVSGYVAREEISLGNREEDAIAGRRSGVALAPVAVAALGALAGPLHDLDQLEAATGADGDAG